MKRLPLKDSCEHQRGLYMEVGMCSCLPPRWGLFRLPLNHLVTWFDNTMQ